MRSMPRSLSRSNPARPRHSVRRTGFVMTDETHPSAPPADTAPTSDLAANISKPALWSTFTPSVAPRAYGRNPIGRGRSGFASHSARSMSASVSGSPCFHEEPRLAVHHREVPWCEGGKVREAGGRREREVSPERLLHLRRREVVEPHLEDEPPQGGGVEVLAEVRGAGEGEGMALHPGQHLVDLAHLPAPVRVSSIAEQRVRFVEDEECLRVAGLGERGRDLLLGLADPGREQVGRALLEDLEPEALGEVARERALAGAGRTLEAEREASPARVPHRETLGEGGRVGIGLDEAERSNLGGGPCGGRLAPEHPGEAPDPVAHRVDAPAREPGGGGRPGPHPGGCVELPGEREHVFIRGLDAVARELPRPYLRPHPGRRAAKLEREHHAPKDGLAHPAGAVHGPEGRGRRRLEQPVHEHLGARVALGHARERTEAPPRGERVGEKVLHLVEEEEGGAVPGEQALGEPELLEAFAAHRLVAPVVRFADAVERHAEPLGEDLAELGLPRAGRAVEEDVHPRGAACERAGDHSLDVIAVAGHVVEVRPVELARGCRVEEQAVHVGFRFRAGGSGGGEPVQPVERLQVPVGVDADEPRPDEGRIRPEAPLDGVRRDAKERGERRILDVERRVSPR